MNIVLRFCLVLVASTAAMMINVHAGKPDQLSVAIRNAADRILPAVVVVEPISTGDNRIGEVQLSAPTSGLVIDPDGYILTSSLPVEATSATILVTFANGDRYAAEVVARDYHRELVVLKIKVPGPIAAATLQDIEQPPIGSTTIAVARYSSSAVPMVASGILSATKRLDGVAIQTDARISPSFYGGPLIDLRGRLLGILIPAVGQGGAENPTDWYDSGVAFAIDAPTISRKIEQLKSGEDVRKGLIGLVAGQNDPNVFDTTLSAVRPRSPADEAGIMAGDKVLKIDDVAVRRFGGIRQALGRYDSGEVISVTVERDGDAKVFEVTLAETIEPLTPQRIGILLRKGDKTDKSAGVIVDDVLPGESATDVLKIGDRIIAWVDADEPSPITDAGSLRSRLMVSDEDSAIQLDVVRDGKTIRVDLTTTSVADQFDFPAPRKVRHGGEHEDDGVEWTASAFDLPTASGVAAIAAPPINAEWEKNHRPLSLLILLADEKTDDPKTLAEPWCTSASLSETVVCVLTPSDARGWQLKDIETIGSMIAALGKQFPLHRSAVAIAPLGFDDGESGSSDRMVLASAFSMTGQIFGAMLDASTSPPAARIQENSASEPLQFALPIDGDEELPAFAQGLARGGFAILRVGKMTKSELLNWTFGLQSL